MLFSALITPRLPGDPTELECRVTNVTHLRDARFGVSWHHTPVPTHPATTAPRSIMIGSLDVNGALTPGPRHRRRLDAGLVAMTREEPLTFKLRLLHTGESDMGEYTCSVSTWSPARSGGWEAGVDYQTPIFKLAFATKSEYGGRAGLWYFYFFYFIILFISCYLKKTSPLFLKTAIETEV